jgi:diguanylate cyclase (GGDEF)-like protein
MTSARLSDEGEWGQAGVAAPKRAAARFSRLEGSDHQRLDQLIASFARAINSDVALLCQPGGKGQPPVLVCSRALGAARELAARPHEGGFVDRALGAQRAVLGSLYPLLDRRLVQASHPPLTHAVAAPVRAETGVGGALIGGFHREPRNRSWTLWAAESYAALFALALNSPCAIQGLLKEARTHALTNCLTDDSTRRELAREVSRSTRAGLELSCCLIDLDGDNRELDQHRNETLMQVARVLHESVRSYDTVGQDGCDQLVVILPHTNRTEARRIAARLESVTATAGLPGLEPPLTVTIGFATWARGESAEQLLARARSAELATKALTTEVASENATRTTAA